jgi:hypothetical protein
MRASATALPDAARVDRGGSKSGRRVRVVSAVQQENVESTTHIFARLAEALSEIYPTGVVAPPPRAPLPAPGEVGVGSWLWSRFWRALAGSLPVVARALLEVRPGDVVMVFTNPSHCLCFRTAAEPAGAWCGMISAAPAPPP